MNKRIAIVIVILAAFAALLCAPANAQTIAKAAPATATVAATQTTPNPCKILKVLKGGVLDAGKEPVPFAIRTENCEGIVAISGPGLSFTEVKATGNCITAMVKVDADNTGGAYGFTLVNDKKIRTDAPNDVYILVFDVADINVRDAANRRAASLKAEVRATKTQISDLTATAATKTEVAIMQARISELEGRIAELKVSTESSKQQVAALAQATKVLAEGQEALGKTPVKKNFWGKAQPLSPEVATSAGAIRAAFLPAPVEPEVVGAR